MLGLRTQEDDGFMRFMKIVEDEAAERNSVFFLDTALGDEISLGNIEGDNCTGWLIPKDKVDSFNEIFKSGNIDPREWDKYYVVAEPSIENDSFFIRFN